MSSVVYVLTSSVLSNTLPIVADGFGLILKSIKIFFSIPGVAPDNQQPLEASEGGNQEQNSPENTSAAPQVVNPNPNIYW